MATFYMPYELTKHLKQTQATEYWIIWDPFPFRKCKIWEKREKE